VTVGNVSGMLTRIRMNTTLPLSARSSLWLNLARLFQIAIICVTIGLFIVDIPINYEQRSAVCRVAPCPPGRLTLAAEQALQHVGLSVDWFVKTSIALDILVTIVFTLSAVIIFIRKPNDLFTIFVTIMLVTFGAATFTGGLENLGQNKPELNLLVQTIAYIGNCAITTFLFIFPNGRFAPRWTFIIPLVWALFQIPRYYFPASVLDLQNFPGVYNWLFPAGILSGIITQIHRYRNVSNAIEKQQTKWVIYGLTLAVGGYLMIRLISYTVQDPYGSSLPFEILLNILAIFFMLLLPLSISIAVLRYRLWDINPIINRTLVYGALSALTIGAYVLVVGYFSSLFQSNNANWLISFIATGMIAVLFEPLREGLQRTVNRLMYGERDDPATVLTQLSQRIDSAIAPDSVLQMIVETLAQTLRLPYAAIALSDDAISPHFASTRDLSPSELIRLPLSYQTERIGELILAPRAPGESFSTADMNLLNIISGQAGIAIHNLRLTQDLQRSREKLVTAQEEERRRLRRDLHDGVGPTLASLSQRIDTAADLVNSDPKASIELLKQLKSQVKNTIAEIRRLVYALRPPILDEFGLVTAIREHLAPYTGPSGIEITFEVTEQLPPLPAAVEVAAYRIVLEAFTNIINHAQTATCHIRMKVENDLLVIEVIDNGKGLDANHHAGVGLTSMHERAAELGGECVIENIPEGGARVRAWVPIGKE
jgi:signal transduction histidine kinase